MPWFLIYEAFVAIGIPPDAKIAYLTFELRLPVLPWTGIFYGSVYAVVLLVPLIVRTRHDLRLFSSRALISMVIVFPLYVAVPLIAPSRAFSATGPFGDLLQLDRSLDGAAAAIPSYHVIWAFLAAETLARSPWQKRLWRAWAVLVSASCVTTGMHALVDVIAGVLVSLAVIRMDRVWSFLRNASEIVANSWKEWRIGPARVINHGAYAAGGVFIGIWVIDTLLPSRDFSWGLDRSSAVGANHRRLWGAAAATRFLRWNAGHVRRWNRGRVADPDRHLAGS